MTDQTERQSRRARARAIVKARLEKLEDISVSKLVPSFLTLLGMCSGLTAIRFAISGDWMPAVAAVVCAGIFDMLDGRAARILGADSRFGAQLDRRQVVRPGNLAGGAGNRKPPLRQIDCASAHGRRR